MKRSDTLASLMMELLHKADRFGHEFEHHAMPESANLCGEIADALDQADRGRYGTCVDCGEEIPLMRLRAKPEAIRCVHCQEKHERDKPIVRFAHG
jgi:DnaK suppressor protein